MKVYLFNPVWCQKNACTIKVRMPLTCGDECVGNSGLSQHALYVAGEELQRLTATAVGVHQYHDPTRPTHLRIHHTCNRQRDGCERSWGERWSRRSSCAWSNVSENVPVWRQTRLSREMRAWDSKVEGCDCIQIYDAQCYCNALLFFKNRRLTCFQ